MLISNLNRQKRSKRLENQTTIVERDRIPSGGSNAIDKLDAVVVKKGTEVEPGKRKNVSLPPLVLTILKRLTLPIVEEMTPDEGNMGREGKVSEGYEFQVGQQKRKGGKLVR